MVEDDIRAVRIIDAMVYRESWSEQLLRNEIERDDRVHMVATIPTGGESIDSAPANERIAGHGGLLIVGDEATLTTIAVDPECQGSAIATRLLGALFEGARTRGIKAMTLEVRASNRRAQRLYHRFGFAPVGVRSGYYMSDRGREDAVIMWVHEVDSPEYHNRLRTLAGLIELEVGGPHHG